MLCCHPGDRQGIYEMSSSLIKSLFLYSRRRTVVSIVIAICFGACTNSERELPAASQKSNLHQSSAAHGMLIIIEGAGLTQQYAWDHYLVLVRLATSWHFALNGSNVGEPLTHPWSYLTTPELNLNQRRFQDFRARFIIREGIDRICKMVALLASKTDCATQKVYINIAGSSFGARLAVGLAESVSQGVCAELESVRSKKVMIVPRSLLLLDMATIHFQKSDFPNRVPTGFQAYHMIKNPGHWENHTSVSDMNDVWKTDQIDGGPLTLGIHADTSIDHNRIQSSTIAARWLSLAMANSNKDLLPEEDLLEVVERHALWERANKPEDTFVERLRISSDP